METSIEELQRGEAVEILAQLFLSWTASWRATAATLNQPNLPDSLKRRINFYESEQKEAVLRLLAQILVSWEHDNSPAFVQAFTQLAYELRPSLPYVETDTKESLSFSASDLDKLRHFMSTNAILLKRTVDELRALAQEHFRLGLAPLSLGEAQTMISEKIGLKHLDFLDFIDKDNFSADSTAASAPLIPAANLASAEA